MGDTEWCASKSVKSTREWIVRSHIREREERNIPYKGVESLPNRHILKP